MSINYHFSRNLEFVGLGLGQNNLVLVKVNECVTGTSKVRCYRFNSSTLAVLPDVSELIIT